MMTPAGFEHGNTEANLIAALSNWNRVHRAGRIVSGDTGFVLERNPDTVRAPDVAFVGKDRVPDELPRGFFPGPPDLAVEIRSPDDRPRNVRAKIDDYLRLGVKVVWEVDLLARNVTVYRPRCEPEIHSADGTLTAPEILPGLELPVSEIFGQ